MARPDASTPRATRAPYPRLVTPEPKRPTRQLSPSQQEALHRLRALGATIDADFTHDELRAVFRALALTYHPDRHPDTPAAEKARLSGTFVTVRHAYDELKAAA